MKMLVFRENIIVNILNTRYFLLEKAIWIRENKVANTVQVLDSCHENKSSYGKTSPQSPYGYKTSPQSPELDIVH